MPRKKREHVISQRERRWAKPSHVAVLLEPETISVGPAGWRLVHFNRNAVDKNAGASHRGIGAWIGDPCRALLLCFVLLWCRLLTPKFRPFGAKRPTKIPAFRRLLDESLFTLIVGSALCAWLGFTVIDVLGEAVQSVPCVFRVCTSWSANLSKELSF